MRVLKALFIVAVAVALAACGGGGSKDNNQVTGQTGQSTMDLSGGNGGSGNGGTGGELFVNSSGTVSILKNGTVDASFTVPTVDNSLGANQFTVNQDTIVPVDSDNIPGALCMSTADATLYIGNGDFTCGDSGDTAVTGLVVNKDAALTLPDLGGAAAVSVANTVQINGTVTADMTVSTELDINAAVIEISSTGKIITSSNDPAVPSAAINLGYQHSGAYPSTPTPVSTTAIINRGAIEANGSNGGGGHITLDANDYVVNQGIINGSGGDNPSGDGGAGGEIDLYAEYGNVYNSDRIMANGGTGGGNGGNGGTIGIYTAYTDNSHGMNGDIVLGGTIQANGGTATNGNGGDIGHIDIESYALGNITINASVSVRGGAESGTGPGGGGGKGISPGGLFIHSDSTKGTPATPGAIQVAGQFDLRGGSGATGGLGGYCEITSDGNSPIELVGFPKIYSDGGSGATGGLGGSADLYGHQVTTNDISAMGGNGTTGSGGNGGTITLYSEGAASGGKSVYGTLGVTGGSGVANGTDGTITIDGAIQ